MRNLVYMVSLQIEDVELVLNYSAFSEVVTDVCIFRVPSLAISPYLHRVMILERHIYSFRNHRMPLI